MYPSLPYTVLGHSAWCPGVSLLFLSLLAIEVGLFIVALVLASERWVVLILGLQG